MPRWSFQQPAKQDSRFSLFGSTFLPCLALPKKSSQCFNFFHIFEIHSSNFHEDWPQILVRLFWYYLKPKTCRAQPPQHHSSSHQPHQPLQHAVEANLKNASLSPPPIHTMKTEEYRIPSSTAAVSTTSTKSSNSRYVKNMF